MIDYVLSGYESHYDNINDYFMAIQNTFTIHNFDSSVSQLYELHTPYMILYQTNHAHVGKSSIVMVSPNAFGRTEFSPSHEYQSLKRPLHQHDYFELMFVFSGTVNQQIEDRHVSYKTGDACLVNRNIRHCESLSTDFEAIFISLRDDFVTHLMEHDHLYSMKDDEHQYSDSIYQLIRKNQSTKYYTSKDYIDFIPYKPVAPNSSLMLRFHALANQMIEETGNPLSGSVFFLEGLLLRFFGILEDPKLYQKNFNSLSSSAEEFLLSEIGHILSSKMGRVTRAELEDLLRYSGDYMNRIIKKYTGLTLTEYGLNFTLKEAQNMLIHTDISISEIIRELGFSNRNYFYKIFSRKYGMTPKEYREKEVPKCFK